MASYGMLRKEFDDAVTYLQSIAPYLASQDAFNWNCGLCLAATKQFGDAEEVLLRVQSTALRNSLVYTSWLARSYIRNAKNAALAWELYLKMESTTDAFKLLKLIGNEYYLVCHPPFWPLCGTSTITMLDLSLSCLFSM